MREREVWTGQKRRLVAIVLPGERCDVHDFLASLRAKPEWGKFRSLFKRMADHGEIRNKQKFKKLEGYEGLWEFIVFGFRILAFHAPGGRLVLTHGFGKRSTRGSKYKAEYGRGVRLREEFLKGEKTSTKGEGGRRGRPDKRR